MLPLFDNEFASLCCLQDCDVDRLYQTMLSGWTDNNNNKRQTGDITLPAQKPCSITARGQALVCYLPLPMGCCSKSRQSFSRLLLRVKSCW